MISNRDELIINSVHDLTNSNAFKKYLKSISAKMIKFFPLDIKDVFEIVINKCESLDLMPSSLYLADCVLIMLENEEIPIMACNTRKDYTEYYKLITEYYDDPESFDIDRLYDFFKNEKFIGDLNTFIEKYRGMIPVDVVAKISEDIEFEVYKKLKQ